MWRWILLALGLLVVLGGLTWLTRRLQSGPPEYVGVYAWDPDAPATHASLALQREAWGRRQGTLTEHDLLTGEALQIDPGPPREVLMVLVLMANGEAGMRPEPPLSHEYATGRWALEEGADQKIVVRLTEANGETMPAPYVLRGAFAAERLRLTVTSDGKTEEQVFIKTSPTSDCTCEAGQAGEPTWCWEHNRGYTGSVETSCWHCTFSAQREEPCASCREILEDKGRRALLDGRREQAEVCLARAYALGASDPNLRFLLAQAKTDPLLQKYQVSADALVPHEPTWFGHGVVILLPEPGRLLFMSALRGDSAAEHRFEGEAPFVAISPAGTHVAVSAGSSVRVIDVRGARPALTLALDEKDIVALTWSTSGGALAAGSESGTVRVWSVDGHVVCTIPSPGREVMNLALDDTASRLAVTYSDAALAVWPCAPGATAPVFERPKAWSSDLLFLPVEGHLACAGLLSRTVTLRDGRSGGIRATYTGPGSAEMFGHVAQAWGGRRLLYSDGSATFVLDPTGCIEMSGAAGDDQRCRLPDLGQMPSQRSWLTGSPVTPDGLRFATGDAAGVVRVWAADTLALLAAYETNGGNLVSVAFTPDGDHLVALDAGGRGYLWKTQLETRTPAAVEADVNARTSWRLVGRKLVRKDGR